MSRLWVVRSLGFIDHPTVVALRKLGHEVFAVDNHGNAEKKLSVDIDYADLEYIFEEIKPQDLIHLAA